MANRKLQTEIDRTLKKVQEGIEVFDQLYNKVYNAPTPQQKEKYEAELKKEIKKLQRYRDQIKTWAASSEVKDKSPLLEARKVIEQDMERFKVCEKETKTKAFSKEGLAQAVKQDPAAIAREKAAGWLGECVQTIEQQKETVEAELEGLGGGKKKKGAPSAREDEIKEIVERHNFHITNLEQLLRLLENESIQPTDIDDIKEGVEYYIESNEEPDFYDDDAIYDDIKALAEVKDNPDASIAVAALAEKEAEEEAARASAPEPEAPKKEEPKSAAKTEPKSTPHQESTRAQPALPIPLPTPLPQPATNQQAQQRAQQQAAQAAAQQQAQARAQAQAQAVAQAHSRQGMQPGGAEFSQLKQNFQQHGGHAAGAQGQQAPQGGMQQGTAQPLHKTVGKQDARDESVAEAMPRRTSLGGDSGLPVDDALAEDTVLGGDEDGSHPLPFQMLEASFRNIPDPSDSERPKTYAPRNAYPTHATFPDKPLSLFENPAMFEKLDIDTLFFIFYFQQGTYQQYLAARELKKQSWRFHKKYMTWFQRHEEPKVTTDEFEQGTYVYFDFETGWCQRIKSEFTFEYSYLEDELQV